MASRARVAPTSIPARFPDGSVANHSDFACQIQNTDGGPGDAGDAA